MSNILGADTALINNISNEVPIQFNHQLPSSFDRFSDCEYDIFQLAPHTA